MVFSVGVALINRIKTRSDNLALIFLTILILIPCLHLFIDYEFNIKLLFATLITIAGVYSVSVVTAKHFINCYLHIIFVISIVSLFFWLICFVPSIKEYLYYNVATNFPSLNKEIANTENGGINFIIYNFQSLWIDEIIGISRNCGPFWEPGMFAVYLVSSLYLYNFGFNGKIKYFNIITILALVSTLSTGGIIAGLFVGIVYFFSPKVSKLKKILFSPILVLLVFFVLGLEYIGGKTLDQLDNSEIGSDASRFGAMKTQLDMIINSPFIGGEKIESYTTGKTLASGLLLPMVNYGIIGGGIFYMMMLISYIKIFSRGNQNLYGYFFFVLMLILSISQTILTMPFFLCLIFVGLESSSKMITNNR